MKIDHKEAHAVIGRTVELTHRELELLTDKLQAFKDVIEVRETNHKNKPRGFSVINSLNTEQKDALVKSVIDIAGFLNQVVQDIEPSTVVEDKLFGKKSDELEILKTI